MSPSNEKIAVIGAGSWGTALALQLGYRDYHVDLWVYEKELCTQIQDTRRNSIFLPGFLFPDSIHPSNDLATVVGGKKILFLVVPSHVVRGVARQMKPYLGQDALVINASKGVEEGSLLTISGILREEWGPDIRLATISGPTFAKEVAQKVPTTMVAASPDPAISECIQELLSSPTLRVFNSTDLLGVEIGGSLKNVIAIAAGICDGLELGNNARAGLITRGLVEITRIGTALGARPETFSGLSGLGDLVLTCTGNLSRNRMVGIQLAQGKSLKEITEGMAMVAEGVHTVHSARALKEKLGIKASIIEETYLVLYEGKSPRQALEDLMKVEIAHEFSGVKGLK